MPAVLTVDPRSGVPIYLQIIEQVKRSVALGILQAGEQLPTVKQLAIDLTVNPNTVARAYRELEREQVIETCPRKGIVRSRQRRDRGAQSGRGDRPRRARRRTARGEVGGFGARRSAQALRRGLARAGSRPLRSEDMSTITISNLRKFYGRIPAVDGFSLEIPGGERLRSRSAPTAPERRRRLSACSDLARPTSGEILYDGKPLVPEMFERIAYVPERSVLYDWMTVERTRRDDATRVSRVRSRARIRAARAVQHRPAPPRARPFQRNAHRRHGRAGLRAKRGDPGARRADRAASIRSTNGTFLSLMINEAAKGNSVIFSSHQIGQVERAAEHIAVMDRGQLVLQGLVDDLKGRSQDRRRNLPRRQLHARRDRQRFARGANRSHRADRPPAGHGRRG